MSKTLPHSSKKKLNKKLIHIGLILAGISFFIPNFLIAVFHIKITHMIGIFFGLMTYEGIFLSIFSPESKSKIFSLIIFVGIYYLISVDYYAVFVRSVSGDHFTVIDYFHPLMFIMPFLASPISGILLISFALILYLL